MKALEEKKKEISKKMHTKNCKCEQCRSKVALKSSGKREGENMLEGKNGTENNRS